MRTRRVEHAALVVNTASRRGKTAYETAKARLLELGVPLKANYPISDASRLAETVTHLAEAGHDLVVVGGGDGTLSTAADHLAGRGATLGILPLGTANDLARTLQIPTDLDEACRTVAEGKIVDVDLGRVGDSYFVNVASMGMSVGVTQRLDPTLKRRLGPLAYPVATLRAYRGLDPFAATLEFPQDDHERVDLDDLLQLAVGNGRYYGGGQAVSPTAGIDDHTLDVYAIRRGRFRDHVHVARRLRGGDFVHHDNVLHLTTRAVRVHADPEQQINIDGEVVTATPQDFVVDRNALDVVVPQESTAAEMEARTDDGDR